MALADDLEKADIAQDRNRLVAVGLAEDTAVLYAYCVTSEDDGANADSFHDASTKIQIAESDDVAPSVVIASTGELVVTIVDSGAVETWMSADWGETWSQIAASP